MDYDKEET